MKAIHSSVNSTQFYKLTRKMQTARLFLPSTEGSLLLIPLSGTQTAGLTVSPRCTLFKYMTFPEKRKLIIVKNAFSCTCCWVCCSFVKGTFAS